VSSCARPLAAALDTRALSGRSSVVTCDVFDRMVSELRATDTRLQEQITGRSQHHDSLVVPTHAKMHQRSGHR
jgi:hypothetical protein